MFKIYGGRKFKVDESGYLHMKGTRLHRIIWEIHNGPIPKGYDVHHKDGNKLNNAITNLECLSHSAHLSMHMKENAEKVHAWHKSPEGRKKLGDKASKLMASRPFKTFNCPWCHKDFESQNIYRVKYCSIACQQSARRNRGEDNIERVCVICSKPFQVNKYYATITCGYACGSKYRTRNAKGKRHGSKK